jgi:hypothetical protein
MFDIRLPKSSNGRLSKFRRRRNPATSGHRNTDGAGIQRHLAIIVGCRQTEFRLKLAGIRPWSEASQIWTDPATDSAGSGQNSWNPTTATGRCRIPATIAFSSFVIFSYAPNVRKKNFENFFFLKKKNNFVENIL